MEDKEDNPSESVTVCLDELRFLGLDPSLEKELLGIQQESSGDVLNYPSPFKERFSSCRQEAMYWGIEDRAGNSLLTIYYFDPKEFAKTILKYSKNLQKAVFKLRDPREKKVVSREYWKNIEAMRQKFESLHDYVEKNGLDTVLLGNAGPEEIKSKKKEVLHYLEIGRDVSKLYSDFIRYYINLQDPGVPLTEHEHHFYRKPEDFMAYLKNFIMKAKKVLEDRNGEIKNINRQKIESLRIFLKALPRYGVAYLGRELKGKEMSVVVEDTLHSIEDLLKKYCSIVPVELKVAMNGKNGKGEVRVPHTQDVDYPEAAKNLEGILKKIEYPDDIRFEGMERQTRLYANRLYRAAEALSKFENGFLAVDLGGSYEDITRIEKEIDMGTLTGRVYIGGRQDPATMKSHIGKICRFLNERIKKVDPRASPRGADSIEMMSEEEYVEYVNNITTKVPDFRPGIMH